MSRRGAGQKQDWGRKGGGRDRQSKNWSKRGEGDGQKQDESEGRGGTG